MSQIIQRVKDEYQFTVSYRKAWLGKQKALAMVYGKWEAPYDTLRRWMRAVQDHLSGTIISFQHSPIPNNDSDVQFLRLFWAFKPCIDAWAHFKLVIQVDGTFLYVKYHHTLLIAMGQDGNRNNVPLAFAIVEGETKEAWPWFLFSVREFVIGCQEGVSLISDRSTGCLAAVENEAVD
ncbi:protein FAR1-related sequence 8-like [Senna tora]|uniref:Protein FAR1-related sequence 8-like n=1 Tax=Senna tora TaxID=362788 RepID=A0A834TVR3_9FABA|nr:protein FAR1-related sequence 8-like [Senna tora]